MLMAGIYRETIVEGMCTNVGREKMCANPYLRS